MLDVHPPEHRIGGRKDFFLHLFTITVGLLIALALESAAESVHHLHLRREAESNIRHELSANRDTIKGAAPAVMAERANLLKFIARLEDTAAGKPLVPGSVSVAFQEAPIPDAAWRTAGTTGALSYMDYGEVELLSNAYKEQSLLENTEEQALNDYLEFSNLMGHPSLTAEQATSALPAARRALGHVNGMLALGQGTLNAYNDALK